MDLLHGSQCTHAPSAAASPVVESEYTASMDARVGEPEARAAIETSPLELMSILMLQLSTVLQTTTASRTDGFGLIQGREL
jgi:hypothetical protein